MLGEYIHDPHGYDGVPGTVEGLGLLRFNDHAGAQTVVEVQCASSGLPVKGYEIHVGNTSGRDCDRPLTYAGDQKGGAKSANGASRQLHSRLILK